MRNLLQSLLLGVVRLIVGAHGRHGAARPNNGQTIYFANHASHVDTLAILAALPRETRAHVRPVAARDYWDSSSTKRFIANHVLNVVFVERKRESGEDPLERVKEALATGSSLIIFPEGTRSLDGDIGPFKSGLYWLSRQFPNVALVPVHLSNLARAMPKGAVLPVPVSCHVSFGGEIARAAEDKDAFLFEARASVIRLQNTAKG
ncbi:lysophospholipid acyltransferase family protein [Trinickia soli]|jgi:1-acyl-sn-glycerol-3-phosphate acyltransferase|uniref:lysophospholipid acyltransferase family protein n=1 Tax=Trinickia soli TaxID=380675 RepID=UPI003FA3626C